MEEKKYTWTFPHVKGTMSTANIMRMVLLALLPAAVFGVIYFGPKALGHILVCVVTCVLTEFVFEAFADRPLAVTDCSAAVTGLLLALMLPVGVPLWYGILGGVFAIAVIKMAFGGIGKNRLNPALSGYCLLLVLFSDTMRDYSFGDLGPATLLGRFLQGETVDPLPLILGNTNGGIGQTSSIAILAGAIVLLSLGIIRLRIPLAGTFTFLLTLFVFGGRGFDQLWLTTQVCGGGFVLGIWFMAEDYTTSPVTRSGQILYGALIGILAAAMRLWGVEEAIVYAILLANLTTPLLEKLTVPRAFGQRRLVKVSKD